jgi:phosphoribosyl 1,2-cyclic phosphodiesterase
MEELKTCSLSSGSSGNSIYIGCGGTNILIDAGRSAKALTDLLAGIGVQINELSAIFITHEHIDHVSALKVLINKYKLPVYMVWESFNNLGSDYKDALGEVINFIKPDDKINIGDLTVGCYPVQHDSAANVGYIINYGKNKAVGIATDIGSMSKQVIDSVCGCKILYIESNHDLEMLKNSSYPEYLKQRIRSRTGHLSNKDCAEALPYLIKNGTEKIILYHLSGENNIKELALKESKRSILDAKLNAGTVHLGVAPKSGPSRMISMKLTEHTEKIAGARIARPAKIAKKIKKELPEFDF